MSNSTKYVGLDVHQATTLATVRQSSGKIIARSILPTEEAALLEFVAGMRGAVHVAFEEGTQAQWLHDLLVAGGCRRSSGIDCTMKEKLIQLVPQPRSRHPRCVTQAGRYRVQIAAEPTQIKMAGFARSPELLERSARASDLQV
jgi:hypothetical protein